MHPKIPYWPLLPMMMLGLAGCAEFDQRKGLAPIVDGTAVQAASFNKTIIINALAEDAGYRPGEPVDYYKVTEAGFNFVDDQCRDYFDSLFFLQRRRGELKSGLAASAATTATILGITNATVPTLTIVAAAFGLASSATDIVAGTYLYTQPPAITQGFVERLQLAYRAGAANNRALINTPTSAYYQIQRYLNLCLPPTIEAEITRQISSSSAVFVPSGSGAIFDVQSVGAPASALPRVGEAPGSFRGAGPGSVSPDRGATTGASGSATVQPPVQHAKNPVVPTQPTEFSLSDSITPTEKLMHADVLGEIQRNVLCVPKTAKFDRLTRDGIMIFKKSEARSEGATNKIEQGAEIEDMIRKGHGRACPAGPEGAQNYYELKRFFVRGELQTDMVKELQRLLNAKLEGGQIDENGLGPATRKKIAAVRQKLKDLGNDLGDPPSAETQVTKSLLNALSAGVQ